MLSKNLRLFIGGVIILFSSCQSGQSSQDTKTTNVEQSNFHKVVVQDILQASEYTYLHVKENATDEWLAVPTIQAKAGDTYYYEGGVEMKKFESKELNKVFESIILLEKINTEPKSSATVASDNKAYTSPAPSDQPSSNQPSADQNGSAPSSETYKRKATPAEKKDIKIPIAKGGISISDLYAKKDSYAGKTVTIKGQVTKYTPGVMNKNWIHIQDGTDFSGKFDLTVTSDKEASVGDIVTLEGKIALNKDLGYGYFFDVIMEDAIKK